MTKILYVQTSGPDTPERTYAPMILGATARAMDIEASVFFMIKGALLLKNGEAEKIQLGDFPPLKEMMDQALAAGVTFYLCEQSVALFGLPKGDFIPEATVAGGATLNDLALEADTVLSF